MSDAQHYRTKDEVEEYKKIDPISQVLEVIRDKDYASEDQIKEVAKKVKDLVLECQKFAEDSDYPPINQLYDVVYDQEDYPFVQHK